MIFRLFIIHNHDRTSSIIRVLHSTTWDYFTSRLPGRFSRSQKVVKEAIMTDVYNLVLEFWRTSSDGVTGACFFAMRRLFEILRGCFWGVRFDIISIFATWLIKPTVVDKPLSLGLFRPIAWRPNQSRIYDTVWRVSKDVRSVNF